MLDWPFRVCGDGVEKYNQRMRVWKKLVGTLRTGGYCLTGWMSSQGPTTQLVHRVVWITHNGPIPHGYFLDHIDGDRTNNSILNLRLCTPTENNKFSKERLGFSYMSCSRRIPVSFYCELVSMPSDSNFEEIARKFGVKKHSLLKLRYILKKHGVRMFPWSKDSMLVSG